VRRRYMRSLGQGLIGVLLTALWISCRSRRSRNTETVGEEEFWHNRYAQRDLAQLEAAT
jgi:hypothetical protein